MRVRGRGLPSSMITGQQERRTGQEVHDNQTAQGCASGLVWVRGGVWREVMSGEGTSARGEDAQGVLARCSTFRQLTERSR
jgi:hypothetical protein